MNEMLSFRGYEIPANLVGRGGGGATAMDKFAEISDWHMSQLDHYVGVKPTDNVIEIGCGIGRAAIHLTERLTQGQYLGTDVIAPSIQWCTDNITVAHPNFKFEHHDIRDALHNPDGAIEASDIRLSADDESVDLILLYSVFRFLCRDGEFVVQ